MFSTILSCIFLSGKTVSEPVSLNLPRNMVEGSARAYFSVIGKFSI